MRSLKSFICLPFTYLLVGNIVVNTSAVLCFLFFTLPAAAETRIRGEFEYSVDQRTLSEWAIGPIFALTETTELEIPIGQDDGKWKAQMELTYTLEVNDDVELEFSIGLESTEEQPLQSFGSLEGSVDF